MINITRRSCRVCLKSPKSIESWTNLWAKETNSMFTFYEKFNLCTGIRVVSDSKFAINICDQCIRCLEESFNFLVTSKKTEILLQKYNNKLSTNSNNEETQKINIKPLSHNEDAKDFIEKLINCENKDLFNTETKDKLTPNLEEELEVLHDVKTHFLTVEKFDIGSGNDEELEKLDELIDDENMSAKSNSLDLDNYLDNIQDNNSEVDDIIEYKPEIIEYKIEKVVKKRRKRCMNNEKTVSRRKPRNINLKRTKKLEKISNTQILCDVCGNVFKDKRQLEFHRHLHTGIKDFKCDVCGRGFAHRSYLAGHMLTHTGEKKFACNYCDKKFYRACIMRAHQKRHTLERTLECQICNKKFKLQNYLVRHMRIHNDERPYNCKLCGVSFRRDHHLTQHIRTKAHRELEKRNGEVPSGKEILEHSSESEPQLATPAPIFSIEIAGNTYQLQN